MAFWSDHTGGKVHLYQTGRDQPNYLGTLTPEEASKLADDLRRDTRLAREAVLDARIQALISDMMGQGLAHDEIRRRLQDKLLENIPL